MQAEFFYLVTVSDDRSSSSHSMWNTLEKESWKHSDKAGVSVTRLYQASAQTRA